MSDSAFRRRDSELDSYLGEIQSVPLLNAREERELALRMKNLHSHDLAKRRDALEARERFARANLRLVVSIAKGYLNRGLPVNDLVAEGNIGLLRAIDGFDLRKKCRFSTYATWWIRQSIRRALVNTSRTVRVPSYMAEIVTKWKFAENEATQKLGRKATSGEVACDDGRGEPMIDRYRQAIDAADRCWHPVSLDSGTLPQELADRKWSSSPEAAAGSKMDSDALHSLLRAMGPREATILRFRFGLYDGEPMTLSEVGRRLRITRERVRQLEKVALEKLHTRLAPSMDGRRSAS